MTDHYKFGHPDWFSHNIPHWERLKELLPGNTDFLEIGSFEGRSTVWIAENFANKNLSVNVDCIDTWAGGEEHTDLNMKNVYDNFCHNLKLIEKNFPNITIWPWKNCSFNKLVELAYIDGVEPYDFIYIDGSHKAADVLSDAILSWPLLKPKGIMVFDDYGWHPDGYANHQTPKPAIDAFLTCYAGRYNLIFTGYQVAVQKI